MVKNNKGFTLIELLIVIALLGSLAVGLLAALDPFEQLKKGTDTGIRNTTQEIHGAIIRYFAIKNYMPWCDPATPTTCATMTTAVQASAVDVASYYTPLTNIINAGELKSNFKTLAATQLPSIYISGTSGNNPTATVCFLPLSKSMQADPNSKYNNDGTTWSGAGTCKSVGGTAQCYWCVQ